MNNDFLQNLKPGDEVIVDTGRYYHEKSLANIVSVQRVTKTQIILQNEEKFRKSDGWLIGGDKWNATRLQECTPEAKMKIIINTYRSRLFFEIGRKVEDNKFRKESAKTYERVAEAMGIDYKQIAKDCGYEENEA